MNSKERESAAKAVIKLVQQQAFSQEIKVLDAEESLPRSNPLFNFDPIRKEGILCVGGRLQHSSLSEEFRHPYILPKDSHITQLILQHIHSQICHQGRSQTQMELGSNGLWIISCSKLVAKLINSCVQYRKVSGVLLKNSIWLSSLKSEWKHLLHLHIVEWIVLDLSLSKGIVKSTKGTV